jgi:chemotaxis protein methyltransferase CheR
MQTTQFQLPIRPKLNEKDFAKISDYIQKNFGIKLPLAKLILVESRLIKRILKLNIKNFSEYVNFVFSKEGIEEQTDLIDFICTNKTDFFREDHHFKFLQQHLLSNRITRPINIWSSACSSGEEPYTIAMVLEEMKAQKSFDGNYSVLATDISRAILKKAIKGEFAEDRIELVPTGIRKKYFEVRNQIATIRQDLRTNISFERFNLIDDAVYNNINKKFEFIFCRNVLIYFDQPTQTKVVQSLVNKLAPGGILFLGHCETLFGRNFNLNQVQPTIYQKPHA